LRQLEEATASIEKLEATASIEKLKKEKLATTELEANKNRKAKRKKESKKKRKRQKLAELEEEKGKAENMIAATKTKKRKRKIKEENGRKKEKMVKQESVVDHQQAPGHVQTAPPEAFSRAHNARVSALFTEHAVARSRLACFEKFANEKEIYDLLH
jgi:hypothetical protein